MIYIGENPLMKTKKRLFYDTQLENIQFRIGLKNLY